MKALLVLALVIFAAEVGCLLRSAALVTQYGKITVLAGTILGTILAAFVGVYLGEWANKVLPHGLVHWTAGLTLIGIGVWIVAEHYLHTT